MPDFKALTEEMKRFYNVSSLEAVAEKLGYTKSSAAFWRSNRKLSAHAQLKWLEAKGELGEITENFDELTREMQAFYGVNSLEAVAEKMGYNRNNALNWQKKQELSAHAKIKWLEAKQNQQKGESETMQDEKKIEEHGMGDELGGMTPSEFRELRTSIGWTQERLAQELGITARQIINYEGGKTPIKAFIERQFRALVSNILEQDNRLIQRKDSEKIPQNMKSQNITANYYPDISVSAGYGRAIGEIESTTITIPVGLLGNITGLDLRKSYDALRVYGDSMLPYIKDGEIALIERTEQAMNGDVVIANIRDDLYIKYFERHPLGKWVKLRSHNKEYSDIELEGDEIEMLRIVGVLRATISVKVF